MALGADRFRAEPQHLDARRLDVVVPVARRAARRAHLSERPSVNALREQPGHHRMALAADVADPRDPGWCGAVVAVAAVARGCGEIALHRHRLPVDALRVLLELVGRDLI